MLSASSFIKIPVSTICSPKITAKPRLIASPKPRASPSPPFRLISPRPARAMMPAPKAFACGRFLRTSQLKKGTSATYAVHRNDCLVGVVYCRPMSCTASAHICIVPMRQPLRAVDFGVLAILFPKKIIQSTAAMVNLYMSTAHGLRVVSACLPATKPQPQMMATINNIMFAVSSLLRAIFRHTLPFFFIANNYTSSTPYAQPHKKITSASAKVIMI